MQAITIREAHPDDADAIREVQRQTWLATYPNEAYGITREDIEAQFREDAATEKARRGCSRRSILQRESYRLLPRLRLCRQRACSFRRDFSIAIRRAYS